MPVQRKVFRIEENMQPSPADPADAPADDADAAMTN